MKDLTNSTVSRQNILNNPYALAEIQQAVGINFVSFEGQLWITKAQLATFYEIDVRTVDRYIESNSDELRRNGYVVLKGKALKEFIITIKQIGEKQMKVADKFGKLGFFNFREFLNLGMLLTESEKA